jgi:hypothetical protein
MPEQKASRQDDANETLYTAFADERMLLIDAEREGSRSFDKTLVTLAAGSLGFSLTYIQLLRPSAPVTGSVPLLVASWISLGLALMLIMISFLTSQAACRKQIAICEKLLLADRVDASAAPRRNAPAIITAVLNWSALCALATGLATLATFAVVNVPR